MEYFEFQGELLESVLSKSRKLNATILEYEGDDRTMFGMLGMDMTVMKTSTARHQRRNSDRECQGCRVAVLLYYRGRRSLVYCRDQSFNTG